MTTNTTALVAPKRQRKPSSTIPVLTVILAIIMIWYVGAINLNSPQIIDRYEKKGIDWTFSQLATDSWNMKRAVLPSPHQVLMELKTTIVDKNVTSKRSLVYHAGITLSSTLLGFLLGAGLGIGLAVGIVYVETLDKSLMPWIITSQTIPILALAPMVIVVFGALGISGLLPKALISMYLCFFPVAVGMVKGLRSPQPMLVDLLNTYSASKWQVFWRLRLPSAIPFLFTSLKVAIALSLVGAIVAELPTGGQAGLGARLLSGSYYGQTNLIWASLIVAAVMSASLVSILGIIERKVCYRLAGGQEVSNEL
jgi:NitT/TauT family transport system permease protein